MKFITVGPRLKNAFGHHMEISTIAPPWKKSFLRTCVLSFKDI